MAPRPAGLGASSSSERLQALMRHQAEGAVGNADITTDSDWESQSDSDSEASFDVIVDDSAIQAARQARTADITQAMARARTPQDLNAMVAQALQAARQAAQSSPLPTGEDISSALQPTYDHRTNGFMEAKQILRRLETAANAWKAAVQNHQAALSARDLLLPHAGSDFLDEQLMPLQALACRVRAQEKTLGGLLLLRQFPYAGAAGKARHHNEAADRLREACALREHEPRDGLPSGMADIDAALRQALAGIGPSMKALLNAIDPSGKLKGTPSQFAPPGSRASQPEAIEEAWLTHYAQSCATLEGAARDLLAAWGHPCDGSTAEAAEMARALTSPPAQEHRAALRREAALHQAVAPLLNSVQGLQDRATARQDTAPQAPWLHALEVFGDLSLALRSADDAGRRLQSHAAQWSPEHREASREAIDGLQTRIATAQSQASTRARAALHQSLGHLIEQGTSVLQKVRSEAGASQATARAALPDLAAAARSALAQLQSSGLHPRLAPLSLEQCRQVCTAVAQACEDMAQVPGTLAEAQQHAARLQLAEQRARQAAQGELAPSMHLLADLCGAAAKDALDTAAAMELQAASRLSTQREGALHAAMEPVLSALENRPPPAADAQSAPAHSWQRHSDVFEPLDRGLRAAQEAQSALDRHIAPWSEAQRHESSAVIGALQARITAAGTAVRETASSAVYQAFASIWRTGAAMLSGASEDGPDHAAAQSLAHQALAAARDFHGALQAFLARVPPQEHEGLALFAKAFQTLSTAGEALRMPLDEPAQALARAALLETAAKQAREAARSELKAPLQQWALWCDDLRTDAIGAAVLHDMKAIEALCEASDEALSAATWQLSDRLLATHELAFDLPFQVTDEGKVEMAEASPAPPTPAEDLAMAEEAAAIAQRAAHLRASLLTKIPHGALREMVQNHQSSRSELSETAYSARVVSSLLPLFHEASQAIAQASPGERHRVARRFAEAAKSYQQGATEALGDYLEASMRLQSRSDRQSAAIDGANVRQSERLVTLMQRSLEGLAELLECRKMVIGIHARKANRHREVKDGLMTINNRYGRAVQKIDDSMEQLAQRLDVEAQRPGYADIANEQKDNLIVAFSMLIWRGKFENAIVQAQMAIDWLGRFLGPDQPQRTASELTGCIELVNMLQSMLSEQNKFALDTVKHESNTHLVRKMLTASLACVQQLKVLEARIGVLPQALAPAAAASSSTAPATASQKTRPRRRR